VVTVHSRVPPHLRAALPLEVEEPDPFERRVMVQLARALRRLGQVAEQAAVSGRLDAFSEAVPNGVNANLCEAVAGLFDGGEVSRTVLFGFTWAPAGPPSREPAQPIRFGHDWAPIGGKGGRLLRERSSWPDFELVGPVVKLESDAPELSGRVTLVGLVEGRQARVRMELAGPEYWLALEAHGKGQSLRCAGTLVRDGTQFELQAPRDLELEPEEPIPFRLTG